MKLIFAVTLGVFALGATGNAVNFNLAKNAEGISLTEVLNIESERLSRTGCRVQAVHVFSKNYYPEAASDLSALGVALQFEEYRPDEEIRQQTVTFGWRDGIQTLRSVSAGQNGIQVVYESAACPPPSRYAARNIVTLELPYAQICSDPAALGAVTLTEVSKRVEGACR